MSKIGVGIIGLGNRGRAQIYDIFSEREDMVLTAVCDVYDDRINEVKERVKAKRGWEIWSTHEWRELIERDDVEVVIVSSSWENHIPAAIYSMDHGKPVGIEVGGAYDIEDCWDLVRAYERTGIHCMMLENCCYGHEELTLTKMIRDNFFGKVVHCEGGYRHDLRTEILYGEENRHYRLRNYKNRNGDNYPTHALGPIAKMLDINRGNRMLSLNAMATGAFGLNEYARAHDDVNPIYRDYKFAQGDIVVTNIKCHGGEMITLVLDTTLPRNYSRNLVVRGTKAYYSEICRGVFIEGEHGEESTRFYNNFGEFHEKFRSPTWHYFETDGVAGGHGGMDWLVVESFFDAIKRGDVPPIDTYDTASWAAITPLSELSIRNNGAAVDIPDFTRGAWIERHDKNNSIFCLDR